jgi:cysteine desulfurase
MSIYLDNSATTSVRPEVIEAMLPYLQENWGNPSSLHKAGRAAFKALQFARAQVAMLLNCAADEVYFSSGGTMSNNLALLGRARFVEANDLGRHLITSQIEHPSILGPAQYLASRGWRVTYLPVDREGFIDLADLEKSLSTETSIISIMWANNEIGTVQPVSEIAQLASERNIFVHCDAVQVPGKLKVDTRSLPVSCLSLSGHKFYAPKGIGILFLRRQQNVMPIVFGGGQEMGLCPGTEGMANIVAVGKAAELAAQEQAANEKHLRLAAERINRSALANPAVRVSGAEKAENRLPGHCSFYVPGVEADALILRADLKGLYISSGSACHKGIVEPSTVMRALGLSDREAMGALRVTAGRFTTIEECDKAGLILNEIITQSTASKSATRLFKEIS